MTHPVATKSLSSRAAILSGSTLWFSGFALFVIFVTNRFLGIGLFSREWISKHCIFCIIVILYGYYCSGLGYTSFGILSIEICYSQLTSGSLIETNVNVLSFGVLASAIISLIGAFPFIFVIIVLFLAAVGIPFYLILAGWMYLFSSFLTFFHPKLTPTNPFEFFFPIRF